MVELFVFAINHNHQGGVNGVCFYYDSYYRSQDFINTHKNNQDLNLENIIGYQDDLKSAFFELFDLLPVEEQENIKNSPDYVAIKKGG
jgi:hypothetical protein